MLILSSHFIHVQSSLPLTNFLLLRPPGPKLSHRNTISDMTVSETLNLFLVPDSSKKSDSLRPLNWVNQI